MQCCICRHGQTAAGEAVVTLQRGDAIVVFRAVPAEICDNCGEYYVDDRTADELLRRAALAADQGAEVVVQRYAA